MRKPIKRYATTEDLIRDKNVLAKEKVVYVEEENRYFIYEEGVVRKTETLEDEIVEELFDNWLERFRRSQEWIFYKYGLLLMLLWL